MRRLLKFSFGKFVGLLLLTCSLMLVFLWGVKQNDGAFPGLSQMADVAHNELGLRPQFVGHLDLDVWRKNTRKFSGWTDKFLPVIYQHVGLAIPYDPACSIRNISRKSRSLVLLGFSGMRTLYLTLQGDFSASNYLQCAGKKMKSRMIHGHKVWMGDETYWWEGQDGALVGIGVNPRPPLFSFALKYRLNLRGKAGVLEHILSEKNSMFRGLTLSQTNFAGMFSLSGLEDMKLPQGIRIQFHHMGGQVMVGRDIEARIKLRMRKRKHALRLMGMFHLATSLSPKPIRRMLQPLKAERVGRSIQMKYKQEFSTFVVKARDLLWNEGKLPKGAKQPKP